MMQDARQRKKKMRPQRLELGAQMQQRLSAD